MKEATFNNNKLLQDWETMLNFHVRGSLDNFCERSTSFGDTKSLNWKDYRSGSINLYGRGRGWRRPDGGSTIKLYKCVNYGFVNYRFVNYGFVNYGFVNYGFVSYGFVSYGFVSYGFVGYGFVNYGFVSYGFVNYGFVVMAKFCLPISGYNGSTLSWGQMAVIYDKKFYGTIICWCHIVAASLRRRIWHLIQVRIWSCHLALFTLNFI